MAKPVSWSIIRPTRERLSENDAALKCHQGSVRWNRALAVRRHFSTLSPVIGFLRFLGLMNAAVWLGGSVFLTLVARPTLYSEEMASVLKTPSFPYFSEAMAQVFLSRYFHFHIVCALLALLHLLAEWLYMGRPARKFSLALLIGLFALALFGGNVVQPRLSELHKVRSFDAQPARRDLAAHSFAVWRFVSQSINLVLIGGLVVYVWRVANPSDTPRFISSVKFRG
jgi:hypothetical protein